MRESTLLTPASRTTNGASTAINTNLGHEQSGGLARFFLNVSAVSGTSPSLTVKLKGVVGGVSYDLGSFAAATATGQQSIQIDACPSHVFVEWEMTGTTPNFTFEVHCSRT